MQSVFSKKYKIEISSDILVVMDSHAPHQMPIHTHFSSVCYQYRISKIILVDESGKPTNCNHIENFYILPWYPPRKGTQILESKRTKTDSTKVTPPWHMKLPEELFGFSPQRQIINSPNPPKQEVLFHNIQFLSYTMKEL